jgi:hypothetical protein
VRHYVLGLKEISLLQPRHIPLKPNMEETEVEYEFEVEGRDEFGQPSIIARYERLPVTRRPDKTLSKKKLQEIEALKAKYQRKWGELYYLPLELERAKHEKEMLERELEERNKRTQRQEGLDEKKEAKSDDTPTLPVVVSEVIPPPTSLASAPPQQANTKVARQSNTLLYIYMASSVLFFSMALFPDFRVWFVDEVVVKFGIETLSPPLLQCSSHIGHKLMETFPLTSKLILMLHNIFGYWVLAFAVIWLGLQVRELLRFVGMSLMMFWYDLIRRNKK